MSYKTETYNQKESNLSATERKKFRQRRTKALGAAVLVVGSGLLLGQAVTNQNNAHALSASAFAQQSKSDELSKAFESAAVKPYTTSDVLATFSIPNNEGTTEAAYDAIKANNALETDYEANKPVDDQSLLETGEVYSDPQPGDTFVMVERNINNKPSLVIESTSHETDP